MAPGLHHGQGGWGVRGEPVQSSNVGEGSDQVPVHPTHPTQGNSRPRDLPRPRPCE